MRSAKKPSVNRRDFLKNVSAAGAILAGAPAVPAKLSTPVRSTPGAVPISPEAELRAVPSTEILTADRSGSDFMVDVIKTLGIPYVCANPGSSFRGLHESIINYGGNHDPEFITCCHEESSIAMAHGYAKVEGKPLLVYWSYDAPTEDLVDFTAGHFVDLVLHFFTKTRWRRTFMLIHGYPI